jgi:hypothetical protein
VRACIAHCPLTALHCVCLQVPWLLPNELLEPSRQRLATRLTAASHWLASAVAAQTFLPIAGGLGASCLLPNVSVLLVALVLVLALPETRGKALQSIQSEIEGGVGHGLSGLSM